MATVKTPLLRGNSDEEVSSNGTLRQSTESQSRWASLRSKSSKVLAVYWTFLIMGANDAAYGPLLPYFESYYQISHTAVSLLFLSPVCGYTFAAILNHEIHARLGRRGVACIHSICHLLTFTINSFHPPYPVLVVSFAIAGVGNGVADSGWNAWIGDMANSNELLGILHGLYGVGAVLSPLVATLLVSKAHVMWFRFYNIMTIGAIIEMIICITSFWDCGPEEYHNHNHQEQVDSESSDPHTGSGAGSAPSTLRHALFHRPYAAVTWTCALFLLVYVGIEVTIGGWTVTYLIKERHIDPFSSGMAATGFWLGLTLGRIILGFVTSRMGQSLAITFYASFSIIFGLAFWFLPNIYAAAISVSLQGFFLGPLFPSIIVVVTRILPRSLHVSSIGFASAVGGAGAAVLPFTVGAMAEVTGVGVLPPFILGLSGVLFVVWLVLSRLLRIAEEGE